MWSRSAFSIWLPSAVFRSVWLDICCSAEKMALPKKQLDAEAAAEMERKAAARQEKLSKVKSSLTPEQIRVYREHFELFDLNGDGVISARELRKVSRQMGYRLDNSQIEVSSIY